MDVLYRKKNIQKQKKKNVYKDMDITQKKENLDLLKKAVLREQEKKNRKKIDYNII